MLSLVFKAPLDCIPIKNICSTYQESSSLSVSPFNTSYKFLHLKHHRNHHQYLRTAHHKFLPLTYPIVMSLVLNLPSHSACMFELRTTLLRSFILRNAVSSQLAGTPYFLEMLDASGVNPTPYFAQHGNSTPFSEDYFQ